MNKNINICTLVSHVSCVASKTQWKKEQLGGSMWLEETKNGTPNVQKKPNEKMGKSQYHHAHPSIWLTETTLFLRPQFIWKRGHLREISNR